jgi:hypothetical protein
MTVRPQPATAFVGRRSPKAPEVYALTDIGVERLQSRRRYGSAELDWRGGVTALVELSDALLSRIATLIPSQVLAVRFATDVLIYLPKHGWVLEAEEIRDWITSASAPHDWSRPPVRRRHRSWRDRFRARTQAERR